MISPLWQSPVQDGDVVIFEHRLDSDNYLRLFWDASQDAWVFRKRADGVDHEVSSGPQSFAAGTRIVLGVVYDSTNAGGMKLFVDGVQAGVAIDTSALDSSPDTLTLHAGDGTMQPEVVFDLVAGWSRMLSADEMLKIATDPQSVKNLNRMISFAGTLDEGDRLTLDSRLKTAELFDLSEGSRSNALGTVGGIIPALTPGRRRTASDRTQTVLYTKTQAAALEILFTRRYL